MNKISDDKTTERVEAPKTSVQQKLDMLKEKAKVQASTSPIKEEIVDIPEDIDKERLAEIAKDIQFNDSPRGVREAPAPKLTILDDPQVGEIGLLVISVTTVPFTPAKEPGSDKAPQPMTKYQILVETTQPLQLGKTYSIKP